MLPVQRSSRSQTPSLRRHTVFLLNGRFGHDLLLPLQYAGDPQSSFFESHTLLFGSTASGHVNDEPLQTSATSHTPFLERHGVSFCFRRRPVHVLPLHTPRRAHVCELDGLAPHGVFDGLADVGGQVPDEPVHRARTSHSPGLAEPHSAVLNESAGQLLELPVHFSSMSHSPFFARQVRPVLNLSAGQLRLPEQVSA